MSEPLNPLMGPPHAYMAHPGLGSVGPVIGVLAAIIVLTIVAVIIGSLCSGRRVMGRVGYDIEGWVETKCASCIDGLVEPSPPLPRGIREAPCGAGPTPTEREISRSSSFEGEESRDGLGRVENV